MMIEVNFEDPDVQSGVVGMLRRFHEAALMAGLTEPFHATVTFGGQQRDFTINPGLPFMEPDFDRFDD